MKTLKAVGSVLALSVCSAAWAADSDVRSEIEALKATVKAQQSELNQLRAANGESWLTERRAQEVKALVREVLSDADTRASLADGGVSAGYKGNFFLASEDGNFLLKVLGQVQFRYIYNNSEGQAAGVRGDQEGFQNRRTVIGFFGHLFDPKFTYGISILAADVDDPNVSQGDTEFSVQNAWFAYEFADGWQVKGGQFKAPFLRDELVHSSKQMAVERGIVTDLYTVDYTQGVQVSYTADMFRVMAMLHDGTRAANTDFTGESMDFAVAGRVEVLLAGKWAQFDDYAAWSNDGFGLLLGAAVDYENGEGETSFTPTDIFKWTVDASAELPELMGLSLYGALIGNHFDGREVGVAELDQYAFLIQASAFVIPDKMDVFARWEWVDLDTVPAGTDATVNFVTIGTNYYFQKHAAKLTLDVVWALDDTTGVGSALSPSSTAFGLTTSDAEDNEFSIRGQFQFLF